MRRLASPSLAAACAARSVAPAEGAGRMQRGCRGARRETRPVARRGAGAGCRGEVPRRVHAGRAARLDIALLRHGLLDDLALLAGLLAASRGGGRSEAAADQRRRQIWRQAEARPSPSRPSLAAGRGTPRHTEAHSVACCRRAEPRRVVAGPGRGPGRAELGRAGREMCTGRRATTCRTSACAEERCEVCSSSDWWG